MDEYRYLVEMSERKKKIRIEYKFKGSAVTESVVVTQGDDILFVGFYDKFNELLESVGEPGCIDEVKRVSVIR